MAILLFKKQLDISLIFIIFMHCILYGQDFRSSPEASGRVAVIPKLRDGGSSLK